MTLLIRLQHSVWMCTYSSWLEGCRYWDL